MLRFLTFISVIASFICSVAAEAPRPNIVYIYADDLGWGYIGANGQTKVKTPNLDALAEKGVNYTRGYGCTVCSPARSSQQTGFHSGYTWTDRNDPDSSKAIRADDVTIGDKLSEAGYRTSYFGKWGYGADYTMVDPAINNEQTLPINHGYDVVLAEHHHKRAHSFFQPTLWRSNTDDAVPITALVVNEIADDSSYPTYPAYQDDVNYPSPAYCDDTYAFNALDFIRTEAQTDDPFFCLLAFQIPHTPLGHIDDLPKWFDEYNDVDTSEWATASKQFAAMVTRMDAHIGNLIEALEDPNHDGDKSDSVLDNTLIIFASDNGGQGGTPKDYFDGNSNLRGTKGGIYEGALRVPMIMSWPGNLPENTTSSQIVDVTDMLPTFCELAGVDAPAGIDGVSLAPTFTGVGHQRSREFIIHEAGSNSSIIRGDYKLVLKSSSRELYNLIEDESEGTNIAGDNEALADELEALVRGERTKEPDAFANTYHNWTGADQASTSSADHWSDYDYSNAGTSYLSDAGAPQLSWSATMRNSGSSDATAKVDSDLEVLSLDIYGDTHQQTLLVKDAKVTGRNEVRIKTNGVVELDNGTLDTLRWVDVRTGGKLHGAGDITGSLYHSGNVELTQSSDSPSNSSEQELVLNGGFENGTAASGDYSYTELDNWSSDGDESLDGGKSSNSHSGTYRGLMQAGSNLKQDTGHSISLGEDYQLNFWHQGFSGWSTGEEILIRLYYLNDSSAEVELFSQVLALTSGSWVVADYNIPAISDASAVGKNLLISFSPTNGASGFAGLDDVSLTQTVDGPPSAGHRRLNVSENYHAYSGAQLKLTLAGKDSAGEDYTQMAVTGSAELNGTLDIALDDAFVPAADDTFTIITADSIIGRFQHADDSIEVNGHHYRLKYNAQSVELEKVTTTSKGTPHWWLDQHGLNTADYEAIELEDRDQDGQLNWQEWVTGSDPSDAGSALKLFIQRGDIANKLELSWPSSDNRVYYIESSTDLVNFTHYSGPHSSIENNLTPEIGADQQRFYRVSATRE